MDFMMKAAKMLSARHAKPFNEPAAEDGSRWQVRSTPPLAALHQNNQALQGRASLAGREQSPGCDSSGCASLTTGYHLPLLTELCE